MESDSPVTIENQSSNSSEVPQTQEPAVTSPAAPVAEQPPSAPPVATAPPVEPPTTDAPEAPKTLEDSLPPNVDVGAWLGGTIAATNTRMHRLRLANGQSALIPVSNDPRGSLTIIGDNSLIDSFIAPRGAATPQEASLASGKVRGFARVIDSALGSAK